MIKRAILALSFTSLLMGCTDPKEECKELPTLFTEDTVLEGCYLAHETPAINDGVTLTLRPGVTIIFSKDVGLELSEGRTLIAAGTAAAPILLTGEVEERGHWKGLRFDSSASTDNRLEHVTVEYAGSLTADNDPDSAGVKLTSDSRPVRLSLSHVTVRESAGWGLWLTASAETPVFAANTLTGNAFGPASVDSDVAGLLDTTTTYQGNDDDLVLVRANRITRNADWAAIDVPYLLEGSLNVDVPWTLAPGLTLVMGESAWIYVAGDAAALNAVGTAADPILITGAEPTPGYWNSIVFDGTNNALNAFDYATVEYAGSGEDQYDLGAIVAVADSHGVTLKVTNSTVAHSARWGIWLGSYADANADIDTANTFTDNTSGNVYHEP